MCGCWARSWNSSFRSGIVQAFGYGMLMTSRNWDEDEVLDVCRFYVQTVNANIAEFARNQPSMSVSLENIRRDFDRFLTRIQAEGDLGAAAGSGTRDTTDRIEIAPVHDQPPTFTPTSTSVVPTRSPRIAKNAGSTTQV